MSVKPLAAVLTLLAALTVASPARADDVQDVDRLIQAQRYTDALALIDKALADRPRDPQMRFLRGVVLEETHKTADAIAVFTALTQEYPELAEPYNNLGVIYAANAEFDKARLALENAVRLAPTFAAAFENLGDVDVRLAENAYAKASALEPGNANALRKLRLARELTAAPKP